MRKKNSAIQKLKPYLFLFIILFVSLPVSVFAAENSAVIVTAIRDGYALLWSGEESEKIPLEEFMKVFPGDKIEIVDQGEVDILYVNGGDRETWHGPVVIIMKEKNRLQSEGKRPAVEKKLPVKVGMEIGKVVSRPKTGGILLRGGKKSAELRVLPEEIQAKLKQLLVGLEEGM